MYGWMTPDAALITAVYVGLKHRERRGYQAGIAVGITQDIFSFGILGINMLSKGLIGLSAGWIKESHFIDHQSPITRIIVIIFATVANEFILQIYAAGFFGASFSIFGIFPVVFTQSAINLIAGIMFFYLLDKLLFGLKNIFGMRDPF